MFAWGMPTPNAHNSRRIVFTGKQEVSIESSTLVLPARARCCRWTQLSLMSTGTENIVFNRLFDPGTHWDNWVKYPFYPGYTSVGTVEAVGEGVSGTGGGDRVAFRAGHRSHAVVAAETCYAIPAGLPFEQAVWFALCEDRVSRGACCGLPTGRQRAGDRRGADRADVAALGAGLGRGIDPDGGYRAGPDAACEGGRSYGDDFAAD